MKTSSAPVDNKKRNFLKVAGIVGLGLIASQAFPKKTEAYSMGSSPTSGVVGAKNSANTRIDPAIEGGNLATIAGKDFATQTTLALLKANADKFTFDGESLQVTGLSTDGLTDTVKTVDTGSTRVGLQSEDSIVLMRRMVKLMESKATVDSANRRRITIDAWMDNLSGPLETGTATGVQTLIGIVDTTKAGQWVENQWAYYAVKITAGTGIGQVRMIGTSTRDTLTLQFPWTTQPDGTSVYGIYDVVSAVSVVGEATGGGLTTLVDTTKAWTTNQWTNFVVRITDRMNGGTQIRLITSNTSNVLSHQYQWTPLLGITAVVESGTATGAQSYSTLTDTSKVWVVDSWATYAVTITSGAGADQTRIIASNTDTTLTLQNDWLVVPDSTSRYDIRPLPTDGVDTGTATGTQTVSTLSDTTKAWTTNQWANFLIKIRAGAGANQVRYVFSNTATVLTLSSDWTITPDATSVYALYAIPARSYAITALPASMTDVGTSTGVMRVGIGTDSTIGTVTNIEAIGFYNAQQRFGDVSHRVYNNSIRSQLTFN
jgi:hypothetical protein